MKKGVLLKVWIELNSKRQIEETEIKLNNLKQANKNIDNKEELKLYINLFQLEKIDCGTNLINNKNQS